MDRQNQVIDEYTLAAFIAGSLTEQRRAEVVAYLADNADARELLHMAYEALEAARATPADADDTRPHDRPARPSTRSSDRGAVRRPAFRLMGLSRYVVATVVVISVGLGLRITFGPPTDALRSPLPAQSGEMSLQISPASLTFQWQRVPDAYQYRLVFWDPQEARVVARHETSNTALTERDAFVQTLREQLVPGQSYTIRIDAVDEENRLIQSSPSLSFTRR